MATVECPRWRSYICWSLLLLIPQATSLRPWLAGWLSSEDSFLGLCCLLVPSPDRLSATVWVHLCSSFTNPNWVGLGLVWTSYKAISRPYLQLWSHLKVLGLGLQHIINTKCSALESVREAKLRDVRASLCPSVETTKTLTFRRPGWHLELFLSFFLKWCFNCDRLVSLLPLSLPFSHSQLPFLKLLSRSPTLKLTGFLKILLLYMCVCIHKHIKIQHAEFGFSVGAYIFQSWLLCIRQWIRGSRHEKISRPWGDPPQWIHLHLQLLHLWSSEH